MTRTVHLLVPDGFDDPGRPSGGNRYDRRVAEELVRLGWRVEIRRIPRCGPQGDPDAVAEAMTDVPDDAVLLADGIIASSLPQVFVPAAARLRLVVLLHLPTLAPPAASQSEAQVLSAAAAVITTSNWTRDAIGVEASRVHVVHPGTDAADLAPGHEDGRRLVCVAAVAEHKGHDVVVDALQRIADLPWAMTFVGPLDREPEFVERLWRGLAGSRVAGRVTFAGTLAGQALDRAYATADLVVLASRFETYGMVLTEALARGVPVVASDVGGIPEAVGAAADGTVPGVLVAPGDAAELADVLTRWLLDPRERKRLRIAAKDRRTSLPTWRASAERVAEVLAGVAG